jgi:anaerobic magnesium-protoporphyrin IX monomethyl ester cyclase
LIYRSDSGIRSNKRFFNEDLDSLPRIDWALQQLALFRSATDQKKNVNEGDIYNKIFISDSRGCPARCGHCMSFSISGSTPRKHSVERLTEVIGELIRDYRVRCLEFTGNAFLSDVGYLEELCEQLIKFKEPIRWHCTGGAYDRNLRNKKLLGLMKRSGCETIHFGIETGSRRVLKRLCKPLSLEEYSSVVSDTASAGIKALGYFMFGFPDETAEEMEDTIRYAVSLPFDSIAFQTCLPFPGTSSYRALLEQQEIERMDWSTYDFNNPKLLPCMASMYQLRSKLLKAKVLQKSELARGLYRRIYRSNWI